MQTYAFGDLRIDVRDQVVGSEIRVDWRGKSNLPQPENVLTPFLTDLTLRAGAATPIEMHFEALEFFNSATITTIIKYIKKLPKAQTLRVFYSQKHPWQKIFFDALWVFERSNKLFKISAVE